MEKYIYLAGIIDGEGHFYLSRTGKYFYPRSVVYQMNRELIDWLLNNFGGTVTIDRHVWRWVLQSKKAVDLAKIIQPYLIVKREQVKRIYNNS